jgi:histidine triad (HIT) family protein
LATIFDRIIAKEIPARIVFEDELCLCFHDIQPQAPVHLLMIPKKPIRSMVELAATDSGLMGHLMLKCSEVAKALNLNEDGYRLVINNGRDAGQSVFHIHIHILAGRRLGWPPG